MCIFLYNMAPKCKFTMLSSVLLKRLNFFLKLEDKVNVFYSLINGILIANMEPF